MTQSSMGPLGTEPPKAVREFLAHGVAQCPMCGSRVAWLGDQGACIDLFGKCLTCLLFVDYAGSDGTSLEAEADAKVAQVQALREDRERWCGRRVLPCFDHVSVDCPQCRGEGWILGYPPGAAPADKG